MSLKLLITIDNIKEFRPIAEAIPQDRILPYIAEAQLFDLKPLLGPALYLDFMNRYDVSADSKYAVYQDLLNGKDYTFGGQTLNHPGLIGFLVYFALARFYVNNPINVTRYGITQKRDQDSDPVDPRVLTNAVAELRSIGLAYQADIVKFLSANGTSYPLYNFQDGSALGQTGVKFFDPDDSSGSRNGRTLTSY